MRKTIITKYCNIEDEIASKTSVFEEKFEQYTESKVKKIVNNPKKYPFIKIVNNGE